MESRRVLTLVYTLLLILPIVALSPQFPLANFQNSFTGLSNIDSLDTPNRVVVAFWNDVHKNAQLISRSYQVPILMEEESLDFAVFQVRDPDIFLTSVRAEPSVRYAHRDGIVQVSSSVNDPLFSDQWGPPDLNLNSAWLRTTGTRNRIVAIVDTGVRFDHPDLQANLWTARDGSHGWNCISNNNNSTDSNGHGTAVAGVVAAAINNGIGVAGTSHSQIMSVKVLDSSGQGTDSTVACGIRWAADHKANVINLSLGGTSSTGVVKDAVTYAWNKGVLVVAAAGNVICDPVVPGEPISCEHGPVECPACHPEAIAVSALTEGDTIAWFSSTGSKVELSAPGENILTTCWSSSSGNGYCTLSGTSLASPFVAGIAALLWDYRIQQKRQFTNQMIRDTLDTYVVDLGRTGRDIKYGYGKPDALALLTEIIGSSDVAITGLVANRTSCCGDFAYAWVEGNWTYTPIEIGVTIENQGTAPHSFNVTVNANATKIWSQFVTLYGGQSFILPVQWNAHLQPIGNYTLSAEAQAVPQETDTPDNKVNRSPFTLRKGGDVDWDNDVDLDDMILVWQNQNTTNTRYDINNDGVVNGTDLDITHQNQFN